MSAGRILVVDDDPQIRRVMRVTLTGQGYEVDDARSGEEALDKVRGARFDLVLLDMNMPGMSGLETCSLIRDRSEIGIIMLTVRDADEDKVGALDAGADDYITKPFKSPELLGEDSGGAASHARRTWVGVGSVGPELGGNRFRCSPGDSWQAPDALISTLRVVGSMDTATAQTAHRVTYAHRTPSARSRNCRSFRALRRRDLT